MGPVVALFAFVLILTTAQSRHQHSSSYQLSRLLSSKSSDSQSPVIVVIDTRGLQSVEESDDSQSGSDERANEDPGDEEAYQLYNHLRTHSQDDLSSGEVAKLEETKHVLRAALVSRCRKMDSCARSCPKTKKFTCLVVCQEKFDKDNACDEPVEEPKCEEKEDKCGKNQKRGKTMPPHWFFR